MENDYSVGIKNIAGLPAPFGINLKFGITSEIVHEKPDLWSNGSAEAPVQIKTSKK